MPTVSFVTLGCARNDVDSDEATALLASRGFTVVSEPADADAVVVNTCTFVDAASQESVDTVLEACDLKDGERTRAVVVIGCMAERYREELAEAVPEADAVVGFGGYPRLPEILDDVLAGRGVPRFVGDAATPRLLPLAGTATGPQAELAPPSGPLIPTRTAPGLPWAYVKLASGCDRACTFCAIPSWRGAFRSRPLEEIVAEAEWLAERGARELVLVSENTTSWGKDLPGGRALQPKLLEELAALPGVERVRLAYLQPDELRDELLEAIAGIDEVASYYDLSLQHASAPVLAAMARSGGRRRFTQLLESIRTRDPGAVFRSNFIVGFPGETRADLEELIGFLADARLDWVGVFAFSPQTGTRASAMPDEVEAQEAEDRRREVVDLQEAIAEGAARAFVGRELDVLVDGTDDLGAALGRSYREAPETDGEVLLVADAETRAPAAVPVGRLVPARVVAADGVDLVAVPSTTGPA